jgi:hypothetical protein
MSDGVFIGAQSLSQKDELVLRALVRLLDGGVNIRLHYSDDLAACDIIFGCESLAFEPAPSEKSVRVTVRQPLEGVSDLSMDTNAQGQLSVMSPLRMANVMAVVQSILQQAIPNRPQDVARGWHALYSVLSIRMKNADRRRCVVPMNPGQELVVDFVEQKIYTAIPSELLLSGRYGVGEPRRVSQVEEEVVRSLAPQSLRHLVWGLALRLAHANVQAPRLTDRYRLLRWPDAVALSRPGYPRLAALMTSRAMSCEQASVASGLGLSAVQWFVGTCLALGVAEKVALAEPEAAVPTVQTPAAAAQGWLGQLRNRLKLW